MSGDSGAPRAVIDLALLHYPVLDKGGRIVTTAVTNIDIHDLARSARTYGIRRFFVVTPVEALRALARRIIEHWETGYGSTYNLTRKDALSIVRLAPDLDGAILEIERETGRRPRLVVTSARPSPDAVDFAAYRRQLANVDRPQLLILGTGWGLAPEILERAELRLEPILGVEGGDGYNHLSVRAAGAIVLDRLLGAR
jgi:hypothetical protein